MQLAGRATELTQLEGAFRDLKGGRGRLVLLTGASGVGKTALARGFLDRLEARAPDVVTLRALCVQDQSASRAYGPFRELVSLLGGVKGGAALASLVAQKAPGWLSPKDSAPSRNALFEQQLALWRAITEERQVAIFIDDLQWSDRSTLDLLTKLGAAFGALPLLVICTYQRPKSGEGVSIDAVRRKLGSNAVEIAVRELDDGAILSVVEQTLHGSASKDLAQLVLDFAKGNPFCAEQVVRWLKERKKLRRKLFKHTASARDLPAGETDVETLVVERLEALEPSLRWALEAAALSGSVIDTAVLAGLIGQDATAIAEDLHRAQEEHGLLDDIGEYRWLNGTRSSRFQFRHPVIRRLAAERVTGKRRPHLLSRAAETLEKLAANGSGDIADEIALIYSRSVLEAPSKKWRMRAVELAERLFAPYELEELLLAAAQASHDDRERLRLEHRLATLFAATGREPEALKMLERVFERSSAGDDTKMKVSAGVMLGWLQLEAGVEPSKLSALMGQLVDSARKAQESAELVAALDLACVIAERAGRAEEALLMAEEAMYVAKTPGEPEFVAQAAYRLAGVQISWDSPQEGRELAERARELFAQVEAPDGVAACHDLLGMASFRAGDWDDALHHWSSALEQLEAAGVDEQRVAMKTNIAELKTFQGNFGEASELYYDGLRLAEDLEDQSLVLRCRAGIARLEFERGNYGRVLELTEAIRQQLPEAGAWREDFHSTAVRALSYLEMGDELQAWQEAVRLEQLYQGKEGWFERRAEGDAVRIRVIDLDSDAWLAGMVADQGIGETLDKDLYGEGFLQYHRATVLERTKPGEARAAAERAHEIFEKLGAAPMLSRSKELLSTLPADASAAEQQNGDDDEFSEDKLDSWFDSLEG